MKLSHTLPLSALSLALLPAGLALARTPRSSCPRR